MSTMSIGPIGSGLFSLQVSGLEECMMAAASIGPLMMEAVGEAVTAETIYELGLTQEQVPVLTGQLQLSGRVEAADEGFEIANAIAYGGPAGSGSNTENVDYALVVHEDLEAHHPHGNAKYVENVVRGEAESGRAFERMSADIQRMVQTRVSFGRAQLTLAGPYQQRHGKWLVGPGGKFIGSTQG